MSAILFPFLNTMAVVSEDIYLHQRLVHTRSNS